MKLAIMQPYLLPYIGYFQLVGAVDVMVVYDNIKYTKKGWINRNRYLLNGGDATFSVPLERGADHLEIGQRRIAPDFNRTRLLAQIREAYRKAPHVNATLPLVEAVIGGQAENLFDFLLDGLRTTCAHLGLHTPLVASSSVPADHALRGQDRVIDIARALGADTYVNPIGGTGLYARDAFADTGLALRFLRARPLEYPQLGADFVPWLSIVDVLMFNGVERTRELLAHYDLA